MSTVVYNEYEHASNDMNIFGKVLKLSGNTFEQVYNTFALIENKPDLNEENEPEEIKQVTVAPVEDEKDVVVKAPLLGELEKERELKDAKTLYQEFKRENKNEINNASNVINYEEAKKEVVLEKKEAPVAKVDSFGRTIEQKWEEALEKAHTNPNTYYATVIEKMSSVVDTLKSNLEVCDSKVEALEIQGADAKARYEKELEELQEKRQMIVDNYTKEVNRLSSEMAEVRRQADKYNKKINLVMRDTVGENGLAKQAENADNAKSEFENRVKTVKESLKGFDNTEEAPLQPIDVRNLEGKMEEGKHMNRAGYAEELLRFNAKEEFESGNRVTRSAM